MPNTVKVPLLGNVPKGGLVAGGLAAVGVGAYLWYKHQQGAATPAGTEYAYGYGGENQAGYYGYGSYAYGGSMGSGMVNPYPVGSEYGYGAYGYGYYNPYTGQYLGGGTGGTSTPPVPQPTAPKNNIHWLTSATKRIPHHRTAFMRYLAGLPLGPDQQTAVREAIGLLGDPPVHGKDGYPPKWHAKSPNHPRPRHRTTSNNHKG